MKKVSITAIIVILTAVLLGLYDIFAIYMWGGNMTISWQLYTMGQNYPAIPFGFGFLFGHIYGSMHGIKSVEQ